MYPSIRMIDAPAVRPAEAAPRTRRRILPRVSSNVVALGFTSLFTDISSEMVNSILPIYLTVQLGFSAAKFGLFDGVYGAATAITAFWGAQFADRRRRHKQIAGAGYATSAACKLGLFLVGGAWAPVTGILYLDRMGKGVRTAPRDALISLSSEPENLGESFGVHRALDTGGALLGPLLAFVLLTILPQPYQAIFLISFLIALIGLAVLFLFVRNAPEDNRKRTPVTVRSALGVIRRPEFRRVAVTGGLLGLFTVSDSLLYLTLQRQSDLAARFFPLLSVGTAVVYLLLAIPMGRLADAFGRRRVYLAGFTVLIGAYLILMSGAPGGGVICAVLASMGLYYACTDGVLSAIGSTVLPNSLRAAGLAILAGSVALGRLLSSICYGWVWATWGSRAALTVSVVGLTAMALLAVWLLRNPASPTPDQLDRKSSSAIPS